MKRIAATLLCLLLAASLAAAQDAYESIKTVNSTNWVKWFGETLGYIYDSHGCLHFTPTDIYLLYKTVPAGIPLSIRKYQLKENEPPFPIEKVPFLTEKTDSSEDIEKHRLTFKNYKTEILVYPSLDLLFILVNGYPYAKVRALAGPPSEYVMAYDVPEEKPVQWDFMLTTPTDPGDYKVLGVTDHYLSSSYYKNTIVPFGAWIRKLDGKWVYQKNGQWYKLPDHILADLARSEDERFYNYYDVNLGRDGKVIAARYAGHDFGKYVLLWTADGKSHYPEMGYAAGELVYEQIVLVKDLVHLLTVPGTDDLDSVVSQNPNFKRYRELSRAGKKEELLAPILADPRVAKAVKEYEENRLPRHKRARWETLGLYHYLRVNALVIDKQAGWYERVMKDWGLFQKLRVDLRQDFDRMGVLSLENRQNIVEGWLNDRLEFKKVSPPKGAKYLTDLSFSAFFKPDEETRLFSSRERKAMLERIRKAVKGEVQGLDLNIVPVLNNYNFGVLLNEILGDLYKSHGCMHVSPRNAVFLYDLLPAGSQMKIYQYSERISKEALSAVPFLADLVNYVEDLEKLKDKFSVTAEVKVAVYPYSGDWIIYLKEQPFACLTIRGGPQTKFYLLQGRDKEGKPIFESHPAYPTTPGDYYIFSKVENYVSTIYHDQTIIPMGGIIKRHENKLIFQDKEGNWKDLPPAVAADLSRPENEREYTYYDTVKDASGEVISMRWGSHPFGRYSIQTTVNKKTAWPELIHSSGDLIMEERQLINDLIKVLTAPHDELNDCVKYSQNFDLYRICWEFAQDPARTDLIQPRERAAYRLYFGLTLSASEEALLPKDVVIANKVLRKKELSSDEIKVLIDEGIAYRRSGKLKINMEKILGLQFDTYQYVVTVQKYAHHYGTLRKHWGELSGLRRALLKDFNTFVIKDVDLFHGFMRELMLKRNRLEKLTQESALQMLNDMLEEI
jgi:hypothetical protein